MPRSRWPSVAAATTLAAGGLLAAPSGARAAATRDVPPPPEARQCAALRAARTLPPIQAYDPRPGAPRVFAMQFKQDLRFVESYQAFRAKIECLIREVVVPRRAIGRANVVAFNEDIGLLTLATGSRGATARALFADRGRAPSCESQGLPCGAAAALAAVSAGYAPQIAAYRARFPALNPISGTFVAATDTFVRGFMQTFSDLARRYRIYILGSSDQAPFRESTDPGDIQTFHDPDHPLPPSVYVATSDAVYNEVFLWGPGDVRRDGPLALRNLLTSNKKVPLTDIEQQFQFTPGPATGPEAIANLRPYQLPGTRARIGFATSLPAFVFGDRTGRPAPGHECDDVSRTYMRCLDKLGANLVIQDEANSGRWADNGGCGATCWQPLDWMTGGWREVTDASVSFAYNVTPMMVGNLADLPFDGQSAITQRGLADRACAYVGNGTFQPGDPERLRPYAGPKTEFVALAPWVVPDRPRDELRATAARLAPGSHDSLENGYIETAIVADLPFPPDPQRGGCLTAADTTPPSARLLAPAYASDRSTSRRFDVRFSGRDEGSGVAYYALEARRLGAGGARAWRVVARTTSPSARVTGTTGATYRLRLRAFDRAGNPSPTRSAETVVPLDQSSRRIRYTPGWRTVRRRGAYGGTVARSSRRGAALSLRFTGTRVALIGPRLRHGGRVRVVIDGRSRAISVRGAPRPRVVLFRSHRLRRRHHALRLTLLGRGSIELDAVGPSA